MADDLNDFLQTHKRREGTMSRGDADKPEQTHIGSMIIIMMGCEGGGRERICTALPCFATSRRSRAMKMSIIRKGVILVACLTAMGAWTAPSTYPFPRKQFFSDQVSVISAQSPVISHR